MVDARSRDSFVRGARCGTVVVVLEGGGEGVGPLSMSASIFAIFERGVSISGVGEPAALPGDDITLLSMFRVA